MFKNFFWQWNKGALVENKIWKPLLTAIVAIIYRNLFGYLSVYIYYPKKQSALSQGYVSKTTIWNQIPVINNILIKNQPYM